MNNQNKECQLIPKRAYKSKKRIELRRSSPLTLSSQINEEKDQLSVDEYESDMEIMAILTGNENYLKTHFIYDGEENILITKQCFSSMKNNSH